MPRAARCVRATLVLVVVALARHLEAQATADRGAFLMRIGADTIVIERFSRIADTLQGSVGVKGQPRQDYVAALNADQSIATLTLSVFAATASADAAPLQRVRVTLQGDSAFADVGGRTQRFATTRGAIVLMNNSFAMAEAFTRRARAVGGTADIPAWALSGGTTIVVAVRPIGRDSMTVTLAGQEERLRVDAAGRILGGTIPAQRLEVIRVDAGVAATLKLGRVDYSAPPGAPYTASEVILPGQGGITLGGTLTVPVGARGPVPRSSRSPAAVNRTAMSTSRSPAATARFGRSPTHSGVAASRSSAWTIAPSDCRAASWAPALITPRTSRPRWRTCEPDLTSTANGSASWDTVKAA